MIGWFYLNLSVFKILLHSILHIEIYLLLRERVVFISMLHSICELGLLVKYFSCIMFSVAFWHIFHGITEIYKVYTVYH